MDQVKQKNGVVRILVASVGFIVGFIILAYNAVYFFTNEVIVLFGLETVLAKIAFLVGDVLIAALSVEGIARGHFIILGINLMTGLVCIWLAILHLTRSR